MQRKSLLEAEHQARDKPSRWLVLGVREGIRSGGDRGDMSYRQGTPATQLPLEAAVGNAGPVRPDLLLFQEKSGILILT